MKKFFVQLLVLLLVVMGSITYGMVYLFMEESPEIVLDERMWGEELLQMKQEKLAEYEAREVDVLPSRQGTVYVIDGTPSMHRPEWLTETGEVVLPEAVRESIALKEVIETPEWWFWQAQATVDEIREVKDWVPFCVLLIGGFFGVLSETHDQLIFLRSESKY